MLRSALALLLLAASALAAPAQAEFGPYGADGWPIAADGRSTNPFPGLSAHELEAILAEGDPLNRVGDTTLYPYWPMLTAEVQRMARDHPDRVRLTSAGTSTLGLDLWMLEIADWGNEGRPGFVPLEEREVVWVDGGHHSNEYSGVYFALAWAQHLVEDYGSDPTATWIVENRHTWIMPMVNPDGSHAFGRLNANGVNINRNYPVDWGALAEDPILNNPGPAAASEVETRLNIEWLNKTRPDYYASIHCCGNLWLYPYGVEGLDPIDQQMLQKVCDEAFPSVREDCGPIWSTIYPASGSSVDTAYEYTGTVAFGYEMSGREAARALWGRPFTVDDVRTQEVESWSGLLHAFLNVHRYGGHANVTWIDADGDGLLVTVRNDGLGPLASGSLRLSMPSGRTVEVAIPPIPAGEATVVRIPCEEDGEHALAVSWQKRLEPTTNVGLRSLPVTVAAAGTMAEVPAGGFLAVRSEQSQTVPGLVWGIPLALALAALAVRRRAD